MVTMANERPYEGFGRQLKKLRVDAKKSLLDVSGAVELDPEFFGKIESGTVRPTEELIVLLVNHFELSENDASQLWQLAGYDNRRDSSETSTITGSHPILVPMNDVRIIYTDVVNVTANNHGVVINFLQSLGSSSSPMAISRVGMSIDHATSLVKVLNETIGKVQAQTEGRQQNSRTTTKQADTSADTTH